MGETQPLDEGRLAVAHRIEVGFRDNVVDALGNSVCRRIIEDLHVQVKGVKTIDVYTINGRAVQSIPAGGVANVLRNMRSGGVYIVARKLDDGRLAVVPVVKE